MMKLSIDELKSLEPGSSAGEYRNSVGKKVLLFEVNERALEEEDNRETHLLRPVLMSEAQRQSYIASPEGYRDPNGKAPLTIITVPDGLGYRKDVEETLAKAGIKVGPNTMVLWGIEPPNEDHETQKLLKELTQAQREFNRDLAGVLMRTHNSPTGTHSRFLAEGVLLDLNDKWNSEPYWLEHDNIPDSIHRLSAHPSARSMLHALNRITKTPDLPKIQDIAFQAITEASLAPETITAPGSGRFIARSAEEFIEEYDYFHRNGETINQYTYTVHRGDVEGYFGKVTLTEVGFDVQILREKYIEKGLTEGNRAADTLNYKREETVLSRTRKVTIDGVEEALQIYQIDLPDSLKQIFHKWREQFLTADKTNPDPNLGQHPFENEVLSAIKARVHTADSRTDSETKAPMKGALISTPFDKKRSDEQTLLGSVLILKAANDSFKKALTEICEGRDITRMGRIPEYIAHASKLTAKNTGGQQTEVTWDPHNKSYVVSFDRKFVEPFAGGIPRSGAGSGKALKDIPAVQTTLKEFNIDLTNALLEGLASTAWTVDKNYQNAVTKAYQVIVEYKESSNEIPLPIAESKARQTAQGLAEELGLSTHADTLRKLRAITPIMERATQQHEDRGGENRGDNYRGR